jgi:transposase
MCPTSDNPASCEILAVTHFLHGKNISAAEIYRELCSVYGQNAISGGTVRQWCRMFKDVPSNVHDEERSGRPSNFLFVHFLVVRERNPQLQQHELWETLILITKFHFTLSLQERSDFKRLAVR